MIDSAAPSGSRAPWLGSFDVGMRKNPSDERDERDRDVDPEDRAPPEVVEQQSAGDGSDRHAEPGEAGPDGDRPAPLAGSRKTLARIDSVDGMINAPPMPMNARLRINCVVESDIAADTEPSENTSNPVCRAPLRPKRSLRLPVVSSRPANTRT